MNSTLRHRGFTLLEVMVALVIVALGLMAAFGQVNQTLTAASRLREKTLAHWVALNQMTELRLKGEFPALGSRSDDVEMARTTWRYTIKVIKTPVDALRRVDINVAYADRPDSVVTALTGFIGQSPATSQRAGAPPLSDWPEPAGP